MTTRQLRSTTVGQPASDGAGVRLMRLFHSSNARLTDPFLMFDAFGSSNPNDYIAGFPAHPHRGFETITYMLEGHMRHEDHLGNVGELTQGGVQWMIAGKGVIHSEMPQQKEGRMYGFQLWLNLPAKDKMQPASYRDYDAAEIPEAKPTEGTCVRVIAGEFSSPELTLKGAVQRPVTEPQLYDLHIAPHGEQRFSLPKGHRVLLYAYKGDVLVGDEKKVIKSGELGWLSEAGDVLISAEAAASVLVVAGRPLNEPIAHYGPFVMNTPEEIQQAIRDYQNNQLV